MKKLILSVSCAAALMIAVTACNSTKSVSGNSDSTRVDPSVKAVDTSRRVMDTTKTLPPDTTKKQ